MKRVAVIMPQPYRGGTLRAAIDMARMLRTAAGDPLDVIFATVDEPALREEGAAVLQRHAIAIRSMTWRRISGSEAAALEGYAQLRRPLAAHPAYLVPSDAATDLTDCDFWLLISDRVDAPLLPLRPYGIVVFDCVQRYVPSVFLNDGWARQLDALVPVAREASVVVTTTPATAADVNAYCGVPRARIVQVAPQFSPPRVPSNRATHPRPYIAWVTNRARHKNHGVVIEGLRRYYETTSQPLDTLILGVETEYLRPGTPHDHPDLHAYLRPLQDALAAPGPLRDRVTVLGETSDAVYASVVSGARLLLHSALYDNGTFAALDAAYLGVPVLSSRYPAMEYYQEAFGLDLHWFDPHDPADLAAALDRMNGTQGASVDVRERLDGLHWSRQADAFREVLAPWLEEGEPVRP